MARHRGFFTWGEGLGALVLCAVTTAASTTQHVVVLYGERIDLPALSTIDASLTHTLHSSAKRPLEVYREEMDLSRFPAETRQSTLRHSLKEKYAGKQIDVAIAVMSPALDFLMDCGATVFPGATFVFCGIDRNELSTDSLPLNMTGVFVKHEFAPTLELALSLHPDTRQVKYIAGTSPFDERLLEQARQELRPFEDRVPIEYLVHLSFEDLLSDLANLPKQTVVLFSTLLQDGDGNAFVPREAVERIAAAASAPVYGIVDQYFGRGIVGGSLYLLDTHGEEAGNLALRLLAGASPESLPPFESGASRTVLDWRQLQRWQVDARTLPPGADIRYRPATLWGEHRWFVLAVIAVVALQTVLILGLFILWTRQRRAERQFRQSELRFRTTAHAAPMMIWITDNLQRPSFMNQVWIDFAGGDLQKLRQEDWTNRVHPDDLDRCLHAYQHSLRDRAEMAVECRLRRNDKTYRWVLCKGTPLAQDEEDQGYILCCADVHERYEAELAAKRHSTELAHLTRVETLGHLTSSIAHDLNQPLGAIMSNSDAALMLLERPQPDLHELREILLDVRKDDERASSIIGRMRDLLQRREIVRKPLDLNDAVREIVQLLQIEAESRHARLCFQPAPHLPEVLGDRVHLQQVLMNLVLNGFDAVASLPERNRHVIVRTLNDDPSAAKIAVADSGFGVSPECVDRLFDPFFTTKAKGVGIGLSISRTIVDAHDGCMWVENPRDSGATFYVLLPVSEEAKP